MNFLKNDLKNTVKLSAVFVFLGTCNSFSISADFALYNKTDKSVTFFVKEEKTLERIYTESNVISAKSEMDYELKLVNGVAYKIDIDFDKTKTIAALSKGNTVSYAEKSTSFVFDGNFVEYYLVNLQISDLVDYQAVASDLVNYEIVTADDYKTKYSVNQKEFIIERGENDTTLLADDFALIDESKQISYLTIYDGKNIISQHREFPCYKNGLIKDKKYKVIYQIGEKIESFEFVSSEKKSFVFKKNDQDSEEHDKKNDECCAGCQIL